MIELFLIYLLVINVVAYFYYRADKRKARSGQWRVSESTLLILAAVGGAIGAYMAMKTYRHKTRHWKFKIPVPALAIMWAVLAIYICLP